MEESFKGGVFSASGQWNNCESRIGNAGVIHKAQKKHFELNVNAKMKVADKKSEAQLRAHEKAQSALGKFKFDCGSMNDKDWGDLICWVLPQAKVDFAVKGFEEEGIYSCKARNSSKPLDHLHTLPGGSTCRTNDNDDNNNLA